MGRDGSGVSPRKTSIQIGFTFNGERKRLTLKAGGEPMRPTPANLKYAERLAAEIRQKIKAGAFSMAEYFPDEAGGSDGTVGAMLDAWLKTLRAPKSTKAKYTSAAGFWKDEIGKKPVRLLKPSDIRAAIAAHPGTSGKTLNDYTSVLRRALSEAVQDGDLASNPAEAIEALPHQPPPVDPFTQDEADQIIAKIREREGDAAADYAEFRFFTGVRTGEALGLQWATIDLKRKHMVVRESQVRGEHKDSTKTSKARTVDLNSRAHAALLRQKKRTYLAGKHVFLNPRTGQPYTSEKQFNEQTWKPALKALGIRYRRPYNTRHAYATMMLMAGLTPAYCAAQLGHSIEMFLTTYSKWINGGRNAVEQAQLERFLGAIPGAIVEDSRGP